MIELHLLGMMDRVVELAWREGFRAARATNDSEDFEWERSGAAEAVHATRALRSTVPDPSPIRLVESDE
jgi:hypothetical protein